MLGKTLRIATLPLLLALCTSLWTDSAIAQYMYLDSNGNGIHDAGDQVAASGTTVFDVWIDTDTDRDGTSATCSSGAYPLDIHSYSILLRTTNGTVAWGTLTNHMTSFTTPFGTYTDGTTYSDGSGTSTPVPAGIYKLASLSFTVTSGTPYVSFARSLSDDNAHITAFGSSCLGNDFDNTLKYGVDWQSADGLRESSPWPIGGLAATAIYPDQNSPSSVPDGSGGAVLAWHQGGIGSENIHVQRISSGGSLQWGVNGNVVCGASGTQSGAGAVTDMAGGAIIVWTDKRGADQDIYSQRVNSAGTPQWTTNGVPISTATLDQVGVRAISDGVGGAIFVWADFRPLTGFDIYAQRVASTGAVLWTTNGVAVCSVLESQGGPHLLSDGAGGAFVAWKDTRAGGLALYMQHVNGSGVSQWQANGIQIDPSIQASGFWGPDLIADGAGGAIVQYVASNSTVLAHRIASNGSFVWGAPAQLSAPGGLKDLGNIASDGQGGAILSWVSANAVFAGRVTASGATPWGGSGLSIASAPNPKWFPGVNSDGAGGAVIVWEDWRDEPSGGDTDRGDVYCQRVNANGSLLWTSGGVALIKQPLGQRYAYSCSDEAGGAFVAWQDFRNGSDWRVYATRVSAAGLHVTGVQEASSPKVSDQLDQNAPNPFNPRTTIQFKLSADGRTTLTIYSVNGRLVRRLLQGRQAAGSHRLAWDGLDENGLPASSGLYVYRLETTRGASAKKMILLR